MKERLEHLFCSEGKFSDLFIQLFVSRDDKFNVGLFNTLMETDYSYKKLSEIFKEISGSKLVKFRELEHKGGSEYVEAFERFTESYGFGKYLSGVQWVLHIYEETGVILDRGEVLGWIAKQRPNKAESSFTPLGMSHYDTPRTDD